MTGKAIVCLLPCLQLKEDIITGKPSSAGLTLLRVSRLVACERECLLLAISGIAQAG